MAKEKKPRREFKPQSHAAVYGVAIIYLGYLLVRLIAAAITGGTDAPSPLHLVLGIVVNRHLRDVDMLEALKSVE